MGFCVHDVVDLLDAEVAVDVLHGLAGVAHGVERLLVDVGRLDRVDLVLEHGDLVRRLLEGVLVRLLSFQSGSGGCSQDAMSAQLFVDVQPPSPAPVSFSSPRVAVPAAPMPSPQHPSQAPPPLPLSHHSRFHERRKREELTRLVARDVLARDGVLLGHLVLQVLLALLQHVELLPQRQDGLLGRVLARLRAAAAGEPAPHDGRAHERLVRRDGGGIEGEGGRGCGGRQEGR